MTRAGHAIRAIVCALLLWGVAAPAFAQCPAGCAPVQRTGYSNQTLMVGYDGTSNFGNALSAIQSSIDYWNQYFINNGMTPPLQWQGSNQYGPPNVLITVDPSLHNTSSGAVFTHGNNDPTNPNGTLALNPDYLGNTQLMVTIGDHEFGHSLGFPDNWQSTCQGNTVMYGGIDPNNGPFFGTTPSACDQQGEQNTFPPPSSGHTGTGPVSGPGGCGEVDCSGGSSWNPDPLVLDLNGDGINTTGTNDMVWFDLDGNGAKDHITWTNPNTAEGFLWINLTGKNRVDNGSELLGIGTVLPDGTKAKDGFQALAVYDDPAQGGNGDGMIDSRDAVWNRLRVWIDANHNGICEPSEVFSLHKFGVEGVSLAAVSTTYVDGKGNGHHLRGQYWRHVGGQVQLFDIDSLSFQGEHH